MKEITTNFIESQAKMENISIDFKNNLQVYGSFMLESNCKESDIDAICFFPYFLNEEKHFFKDFFSILKQNPNVKQICPV
jgi:poly(A) polymerase Pap1